MINISLPTDVNKTTKEQIINLVGKLFENLPKEDMKLQAISYGFDKKTNTAEIVIPLNDKKVSIVIKLPNGVNSVDNVSIDVSFKNKEIKLIINDGGEMKSFSIKLDENQNFLKNDFKIRSLRVENLQNLAKTGNNPQVFASKSVEIMNPFMKGETFEAFILKDIPAQNKQIINEAIPNKLTEPKLPPNSKLIVEITKISPELSETNQVTKDFAKVVEQQVKTPINSSNTNNLTGQNTDTKSVLEKIKPGEIQLQDGKNVLKTPTEQSQIKLTTDTTKASTILNEILSTSDKQGIKTASNNNTLSLNQTLAKVIKGVDLSGVIEAVKSKQAFVPIDMKGVVISTPDDKTQKILISDIGVITLPDLKEKLPFKSIIDLKINNIVTFDNIFEAFETSDNDPFNSLLKIFKALKTSGVEQGLIDEFMSKIPNIKDKHFISKTLKYINAIKNGAPNEIFDNELIENLSTNLKEKAFLTNILKEDFLSPVHQPTQNNNFSMYVLPLLNGDNLSKVWLYLFNPLVIEEEQNGQVKHKNKQRFLLDFTLSYLGNMQFEGFIDETSNKLDLIVKSKNDFLESEKDEMNQIFIKSMRTLDMVGALKFKKQEEIRKPTVKQKKGGYFV
jgi:hypothetical protein